MNIVKLYDRPTSVAHLIMDWNEPNPVTVFQAFLKTVLIGFRPDPTLGIRVSKATLGTQELLTTTRELQFSGMVSLFISAAQEVLSS